MDMIRHADTGQILKGANRAKVFEYAGCVRYNMNESKRWASTCQ